MIVRFEEAESSQFPGFIHPDVETFLSKFCVTDDSHCLETAVTSIRRGVAWLNSDHLNDSALSMDVLPRITRQLIERYREMSSSQRIASVSVSVAILLTLGWLTLSNRTAEYRAVSFGKIFGPDELVSAEQALVTVGLTGFRRDGQRLIVPEKDLDRYNAALLESDAMPSDLGSLMIKQYENLGPLSTDRQRQQMKEALLHQELRRMIKAVPDIEDARVAIASPERRSGWNQKPRATANLTLKPRGGKEISATLVNSLRRVVANMVPDLKPSDVTIFDVTRGQAYTGEPTDDPRDSQYLQRAREFTRQYERQIQKALSYIPHINVTAHVDLEALKSELVRHEKSDMPRGNNEPATELTQTANIHSPRLVSHESNYTPSDDNRSASQNQIAESVPKTVQVSISIPRDYLRELSIRRAAKGEKSKDRLDPNLIEDEVLTKVERIVGRLIPAESPSDAVSVTFIDRMTDDPGSPMPNSIQESAMIAVQKWGWIFGIGIVPVVALWLLRPRSTTAVAEPGEEISVGTGHDEVWPVSTATLSTPIRTNFASPDSVSILRDEIRSIVTSDPSASAALLGRWMSEVPN